jgi:hypothetical protein
VVVDREITDLLAMRAELEATQEKMKTVAEDKTKNEQEIEHLRKMHLNKNLVGAGGKSSLLSPKIRGIFQSVAKYVMVDDQGLLFFARRIFRTLLVQGGLFIL